MGIEPLSNLMELLIASVELLGFELSRGSEAAKMLR